MRRLLWASSLGAATFCGGCVSPEDGKAPAAPQPEARTAGEAAAQFLAKKQQESVRAAERVNSLREELAAAERRAAVLAAEVRTAEVAAAAAREAEQLARKYPD